MKTIWKFELSGVETELALPEDARVLHVAEQHGVLCLWAQVDTAETRRRARTFIVVGTGHPIPERRPTLLYVGSLLTQGGTFVFHVYEATS